MTRLRGGILGGAALLLALTCGLPAARAQRCPGMMSMQAQVMLQQQWNRQTFQQPIMPIQQPAMQHQFVQTPRPNVQMFSGMNRPALLSQTRTATHYTPVNVAWSSRQTQSRLSVMRSTQVYHTVSVRRVVQTHGYTGVRYSGSTSIHHGSGYVSTYGHGPGRPVGYHYSYPTHLRSYTRYSGSSTSSRAAAQRSTTASSRLQLARRTEQSSRSGSLTLLRRINQSRTSTLQRPGSRSLSLSVTRSRPVKMQTQSPPLKKQAGSRPMTIDQSKTTATVKLTGTVRCGSCHHSGSSPSSKPLQLQTPLRSPLPLLATGLRLPQSPPALLQVPAPFRPGSRLPTMVLLDGPRLPLTAPVDLTAPSLVRKVQSPPSRPHLPATEKKSPIQPRSTEPALLTPEKETPSSMVAELIRAPDLPGEPRSVEPLLAEAGREPPEDHSRPSARLLPATVLATPLLPDGGPVLQEPPDEDEHPNVTPPLVQVVLQPPPMASQG
jgi:hypothetical protein